MLDYIERRRDRRWSASRSSGWRTTASCWRTCTTGFWQPMDTLREKQHLEALWESGEAPWKVW